MPAFHGKSVEELIERKNKLSEQYQAFKAEGLRLDMSRGKPGSDQLDLSDGLLDDVKNLVAQDGTDCRNYGVLDGIKEAKVLFASLLHHSEDEIIIGGNSSLNLMYDLIAKAFNHGLNGFDKPWSRYDKIKFLCPSPGYDRHFAITELFGIEMIVVPMNDEGPDMDFVEEQVKDDASVKGMWCNPMYSNPTGITYSDNVVRRLASVQTAASDFTIVWDNAYAFHHLYDTPDKLLNMIEECKRSGNPNRVYEFASTSKVTYPGSGISMMASSKENIDRMRKLFAIQTIDFNKVNQLLHVRFLKDADTVNAHMKKQAVILRPKFETVLNILEKNLAGKGIAAWNKPNGGYFISLDICEGCAKRTVYLAKEAGVTLTPAGATFPYGKDPKDSNIRIAPTYPPIEELKKAIEILCVCVELTAIEKVLGN